MRNRSSKRSQSCQKIIVDSIMTTQNSPHNSQVLNRSKLHIRQSSLNKKNRFLVQLPKIYPVHKKLFNMRSKQIQLMRLNDKRFQLRGFKFINELELLEQSTLDVEEFEKFTPTLKKKDSTASLHNIFSELLFRINGVKFYQPVKGAKIKAFIQEGNNSRLIKELLRKRISIKIVSNKTQADFIWTRFADYEASNKVSKYIEVSDKNIFSTHTNDDFIEAYTKFSNEYPFNESEILKCSKSIQMQQFCMHNHVKNHQQLSDKKNLFKNIRTYCQKNKINQNTIIPKTFHLDYHKLNNEEMGKNLQKIYQNYSQGDFFVVKPGQDTNRGVGISVVKGKQNVLKAVKQLQKIGKSSLIQQYIDPLLYKNRKFDIRCYVLLTNVAGKLKAYWYKEGYLRTCSKQFNYDTNNIYGHLTNDAVQKKCKDYGKYQNANKLSYNDLQMILGQTERTKKQVLDQMKQLAIHSIKSAEDKLRAESNVFSFQIIGYDFLIDKKGKAWLIEINTNPCLQFSGSLLSRIIWHMVDNSFRIAIDPFLQTDQKKEYQNYLQHNKYEPIL